MKVRGWLLAVVLLPLACAGLLAQERAAPAPAQDPTPTAEAPAKPAEEPTAPAATDGPDEPSPPEEQVSADNNLSFPVDI